MNYLYKHVFIKYLIMSSTQIGKYIVHQYSERSIAITGDTKLIKDELKTLGCKWNRNLTVGCGWICSKKKEQDVIKYLQSLIGEQSLDNKTTVRNEELTITQLALILFKAIQSIPNENTCKMDKRDGETVVTLFGDSDYIISEMDIIHESYADDNISVLIDVSVDDKQLSIVKIADEKSDKTSDTD